LGFGTQGGRKNARCRFWASCDVRLSAIWRKRGFAVVVRYAIVTDRSQDYPGNKAEHQHGGDSRTKWRSRYMEPIISILLSFCLSSPTCFILLNPSPVSVPQTRDKVIKSSARILAIDPKSWHPCLFRSCHSQARGLMILLSVPAAF